MFKGITFPNINNAFIMCGGNYNYFLKSRFFTVGFIPSATINFVVQVIIKIILG